jgi:hypothetical protein
MPKARQRRDPGQNPEERREILKALKAKAAAQPEDKNTGLPEKSAPPPEPRAVEQTPTIASVTSAETEPAGKIRAWKWGGLGLALIGLICIFVFVRNKQRPPDIKPDIAPKIVPAEIRRLGYVKDIYLQVQSGGFHEIRLEKVGCVQNEKCPDFKMSLNSNIFKIPTPEITGLFVFLDLGGESAEKPIKVTVGGETGAQVYDFSGSDHYEFPIDFETKADFVKMEIRDYKGRLLYDAGRCPAVRRGRDPAKTGEVDSFRMARYYMAFERACQSPPQKETVPARSKAKKSK